MSASFFQTSNRWHTPDRHSLSDNIVWISTFCMSWYLSQEHTYRQKSDWSYLPKDSKCSPCCSRRNRNRQGMACLEHNRPDSFLKLKSTVACKRFKYHRSAAEVVLLHIDDFHEALLSWRRQFWVDWLWLCRWCWRESSGCWTHRWKTAGDCRQRTMFHFETGRTARFYSVSFFFW